MKRSTMTAVVVALVALTTGVAPVMAQNQAGEARYGQWRIQTDNPPPSSNIMTYAPLDNGGMQVTIEAVNMQGNESRWGYDTYFDGEFRPVWGQENAETAVEVIDERSTRILNRRNGVVSQVIINTLSPDGNRIENDYVSLNAEGKIMRVTRATYHRIR
ncbi:MAG: hypothetical protein WEA09_06890 [Gemmatimonadota bacterium]